MEKDVDINKAVRQHLEMDEFFTGGFAARGKITPDEPQHQENSATVAETARELEKIADEVRQCRKCDLGSLRTNAVPGEGKPNARIMFVGGRARRRRRRSGPTLLSEGPDSYWTR